MGLFENRPVSDLSIPARGVLGMLCQMTGIGFQMVQSKPGPVMKAALDELVTKGFATVGPNTPHGLLYKAAVSKSESREHKLWLHNNCDHDELKFDITVPV